MDEIRQYIIGIVAAALLCGIATSFIHEKSVLGASVKFIAGLLMVLSVIQPWTTISLNELTNWKSDIMTDGREFVSAGKESADEVYRASIKARLASYIQDEAKTLGAEISAEIILSQDDIPVPERVILQGDISPHGKKTIESVLTERLGISREEQIWT